MTKLIKRVLKETTCEGETLDIYIKPAHDHDMPEWKKAGTHQYCVVFHFNNVGNPNYGHSYYIDTIMDPYWGNDEGLCLNGSRWERFSNYESMDKKSMDNVRNFIQEFVEANELNLHKDNSLELKEEIA